MRHPIAGYALPTSLPSTGGGSPTELPSSAAPPACGAELYLQMEAEAGRLDPAARAMGRSSAALRGGLWGTTPRSGTRLRTAVAEFRPSWLHGPPSSSRPPASTCTRWLGSASGPGFPSRASMLKTSWCRAAEWVSRENRRSTVGWATPRSSVSRYLGPDAGSSPSSRGPDKVLHRWWPSTWAPVGEAIV